MTAVPDDEWSDDTIRAALAQAEIPAILPALASMTGDLSLLPTHLRADPERLVEPDAGLSFDQLAEGRELAFQALVRYRESGRPAPRTPDPADLQAMLEFTVGGTDMGEYLQLFREELAVEGEDLRAPAWRADELAPGRDFSVVVVGAGMSGLLAAHRLQQAGVSFTVIEKNHDVGGTWLENTYPGCRVDVSNHLYSYSFAQRPDWPFHFSTQPVLLDYFRECADRFGLRGHIRFSTEVTSATFDEDGAVWRVAVRAADGSVDEIEADAVISAVGQLNRPHFPEIPGMETFAGVSFHSAEWDHDVSLKGKRVAVIGTGASAAQFIPHVADEAAEVRVFQRTPNWLVPTPDYHEEVSEGLQWLIRNVASYTQWYRFWLFWRNAEGLLPAARVDPDWEPKEQSVSQMNDFVRMLLTAYLQVEFADAPDLLEHVVPTYPPTAKRIIRDNGVWARTLKQHHVALVTGAIDEITPTGVRTADGTEHPADVIVYGTGFTASQFLTPMRVTGRDGVELHDAWDGTARAYLGITVPRFPNLFLLYGPNTNIVINGSIIYFSECEVGYTVECIRHLLATGARAIDCRPDVHDAYNERIDAGNAAMAWGVSNVNSWYKDAKGHVSQNWPFSLLEYWQQTRAVHPADYEQL